MSVDFFTAGATPVKGRTLVKGKTANFTAVVPKNAHVLALYVRNNTANAITGGLRVGTTAAGVDVHATIAVGASANVRALPLISALNSAGTRTLYLEAVTAWNSASIDVVIDYILMDTPISAGH